MGKRALVIGSGISGESAITFLLEKGWDVVAVDKAPKTMRCPCFLDTHTFIPFDFDLVVVSPGISPKHPLYEKAVSLGILVIGEAELGLREVKNRCIGITGTKGKTTTTLLITHVLKECGYRARALGNVGTPIASSISSLHKDEILVLELSSYQLETLHTKVLDIAAFINLSPDHLDRYDSFKDYFLMKKKIGEVCKGTFFVHHEVVKSYPEEFQNVAIVEENPDLLGKIGPPLSYQGLAVLFAYTICRHLGIGDEAFFKALETFSLPPHRIEFVGNVGGVLCYNDSKATNPDSVRHAITAIGKEIVLLAGGRHKSGGFEIWNEIGKGRIKHIILFGESKHFIRNALDGSIPIQFANDLKEAVEKGLQVATKNDNLLLSPGCASLDAFRSFEERGDAFRCMIQEKS